MRGHAGNFVSPDAQSGAGTLPWFALGCWHVEFRERATNEGRARPSQSRGRTEWHDGFGVATDADAARSRRGVEHRP